MKMRPAYLKYSSNSLICHFSIVDIGDSLSTWSLRPQITPTHGSFANNTTGGRPSVCVLDVVVMFWYMQVEKKLTESLYPISFFVILRDYYVVGKKGYRSEEEWGTTVQRNNFPSVRDLSISSNHGISQLENTTVRRPKCTKKSDPKLAREKKEATKGLFLYLYTGFVRKAWNLRCNFPDLEKLWKKEIKSEKW